MASIDLIRSTKAFERGQRASVDAVLLYIKLY